MTGRRLRRTLGAVTPADFDRLHALRRMQWIAIGLLCFMAVLFVVSFSLEARYPWLSYVRAASEGGMVGALADWFAVTALFRYPLGIKIPHTNIISERKDEIGEGLGSFIEENFLADDVIDTKLADISGSRIAAEWLSDPQHADRAAALTADGLAAILNVLDDRDVQGLLESLVRNNLIEPDWSPTIGRATAAFVAGGHHEAVVSIAADRLEQWLAEHPHVFDNLVSAQLPAWVPSIVSGFVDSKLHTEAVKFAHNLATDLDHPFRATIGDFIAALGTDLQTKPALQLQVESLKAEIFDSPRVRALAEHTWDMVRSALLEMLADPASDLRRHISAAFTQLGTRLDNDVVLSSKIDSWLVTGATHLVRKYRHDLSQVVVDTVERWDAREAAEKIELQVGKDLQFIRINGTVIGALAGLAIYSLATLVIAPLTYAA